MKEIDVQLSVICIEMKLYNQMLTNQMATWKRAKGLAQSPVVHQIVISSFQTRLTKFLWAESDQSNKI